MGEPTREQEGHNREREGPGDIPETGRLAKSRGVLRERIDAAEVRESDGEGEGEAGELRAVQPAGVMQSGQEYKGLECGAGDGDICPARP